MKKLLLLFAFAPIFVQAQIMTYTNGFEGAQSVFTTDPGSIWERGVPTMSRIDTAHNGTKVWATDLDSNYTNDIINTGNFYSYLYTPFFNIYGMDSVAISFWHFVDLDSAGSKDGGNIQVRVAKLPWIVLGYMGAVGTNWYNTNEAGTHLWFYQNSGWMFSRYVINNSGHSDSIQFRFTLMHNVIPLNFHHNRNGWAIDDFKIEGYGSQHDVGVVSIVSPSDTLTGLNNNFIKVWVKNFANDTILVSPDFSFYYSINGVRTYIMGVGPYLKPGDSTLISFNTTTPIQAGPLTFCVGTDLWGDTNATNDQACITLGSTNISNSAPNNFSMGQSIPNPAKDKVTIPFSINSDVIVNFQLISPLGKIVFEKKIRARVGENTLEFDVGKFANGVYYYSLEHDGQKKTRKLLINK